MTARAPAIELRDVSFSYRETLVLEEVSLIVPAGDYVAILGPNGSGKSTLLKILLGLLAPHHGSVRVLGTSARDARGRVGYVPQQARFDYDFPIQVIDVALMGRLGRRRIMRYWSGRDRRAALEALEKVEMAELAKRPIGALSGGQVQRVLIARALAMEPELLLLDESMSGLDERSNQVVWELFNRLADEMTVVVVSHDIGAISRHVRSVACLNRRLFVHPSQEVTSEMLEKVYGCPVELLAHGTPHRVLHPHEGDE